MLRHSRAVATSAALTVMVLLTACGPQEKAFEPSPDPEATQSASQAPEATSTPTSNPTPTQEAVDVAATDGTALEALNALPVKGRAPMTDYDRSQFGQEWSDAPGKGKFPTARNGCDTRNDILARDLQRETVESNGCVVTDGVLAYEPYTGDLNRVFVKGGAYEQSFDVEHIVALGNAWVTGAQALTADQRAELANDPDNLMLTDPSSNRSKGDADFATWLPSNKDFRCSYAARQIRVKARYNLWVTQPEKTAMESVLDDCASEPLDQPEVQDGHTASDEATKKLPAPKAPKAPKVKKRAPAPNKNVYYANCTAARDAGAAPVRRGDPGYGSHLDRDGDGVACE